MLVMEWTTPKYTVICRTLVLWSIMKMKWMEKILPAYDKEKVHVSDMKKLAKWYSILDSKNLIEELTAEKTEEESAEGEVKKDLPKKESKHIATKSDQGSKANSKPAPVRKITTPRKAT